MLQMKQCEEETETDHEPRPQSVLGGHEGAAADLRPHSRLILPSEGSLTTGSEWLLRANKLASCQFSSLARWLTGFSLFLL